MERQPITLHIEFFQKKMNSLYYKKIIHRKNDNKSYLVNNNKLNYCKNKNSKSLSDFSKLKINIRCKRNNNNKPILNKTLNPNNKIYKKVILSYINLNYLIKIQKFIRGFIFRKKFEKFKLSLINKKFNTENPKRFKKIIDVNVFDAIKKNSKNQKKNIKKANNQFNLRNTFTMKKNKNKNNIYKKNRILVNNKGIKNNSFDFINNKKNENKKNRKLINRYEYQKSLPENEFLINDFFEEQYPRNLYSNFDNSINEDILNEQDILENKNRCQTENNINHNDISSNYFNKKNLILLDNNKNPSFYQTKENTSSERITGENNNSNLNLNGSNNKNNKKYFVNKKDKNNKNRAKKKKKENISNIAFDLKEFDSDNLYQNKKKNFNLIKTNIKYNFNPLIDSKIKLKNINNKNINNYDFQSKFTNDIFTFNKNKEIIKNDKQNNIIDNDDIKSLKSSFYDEDDFIIINYDYTLNDKKKLNDLKIINVENINIIGKKNKISDFIIILKNNIYKKIKLYIFKLLKKYNIEEKEDEKSMTDNESCSYISQGRIEKNNIIFNFAQNDIKSNCFTIQKNKINIWSNDVLTENEPFKENNFYSP